MLLITSFHWSVAVQISLQTCSGKRCRRRRSRIEVNGTAVVNKPICSRSVVVLGMISIFAVIAYSGQGKPQVLSSLPNLGKYSSTLRRNVRKANPSEYLPVRTAWKNPTVVITLERTSIILADGTPRKETSLLNLAKDLATLPKSAWPLGRVVILSRTGRTFPIIPLVGQPTPNIDPDPRLAEADSRAASIEHVLELLGLEVVASPVG